MLKSDRLRSVVVLVFAIAGFAIRFLPRSSVRRVTHEISASGSRLAPASMAFWLDWWLAFALLVYAVWQFRRKQQRRRMHRRVGWFAPAVAFLDAAWPLVLAAPGSLVTRLAVTSGLLLGLTAVLAIVVHRINRADDLRFSDLFLLDATFGLHLGWSTLLAASTLGATLLAAGVHPVWWAADLAAGGALLVVTGLVTSWCFWLGDRVAVALATAWGMGCIAFERLTGAPHSRAVAIVAIIGAAHVLGFTRWRRHHPPQRPVDEVLADEPRPATGTPDVTR